MTYTEKLAEAYFSSSQAIEVNTNEITEVIANEGVDSEVFQKLWAERDNIYLSWNNAVAALRELPPEEALHVHRKIEHLRALITH